MRNAGLVTAVAAAVAVLLVARPGGVDEVPLIGLERDDPSVAVISLEPVRVFPHRDLRHRIVLARPEQDGGTVLTVDLGPASYERRAVGAGELPRDLLTPTTDLGDAVGRAGGAGAATEATEAAARSPDGHHLAVFIRSPRTRTTGLAIYTEGRPARRFHRLLSVGELVAGRLAWSPSGDAVYLLAADRPGEPATRVIGVPVSGSPQTVAVVREPGYVGIGVTDPVAQPSTP